MERLIRGLSFVGGIVFLAFSRIFWSASKAPADVKRILILGYAAIGDLIYFLPVLRAVRSGFPDARIVFAANRYPTTEELLPATHLVDEIWMIETSESGRLRRAAARRVRGGRFDVVLATPAAPLRFFARGLLGIPLRIGHCRELKASGSGWGWARNLLWRLRRAYVSEEFERRLVFNRKIWMPAEKKEHAAVRNLRLLEGLGLKAPKIEDSRPLLPKAVLPESEAGKLEEDGGKSVGVHLGIPGSQYFKIWAPEKWGLVCRKLRELYKVRIILLGGGEEAEAAKRFASAFGGPFLDFVGRLGLLQSFAVIKRCDLFLSPDTGLAIAAMALGVPTATVWGPSDPAELGGLWDPQKHLDISLGIGCAPCVWTGLRREGPGILNFSTCGHHACLMELSPEAVGQAICSRYEAILK